MERDADDRTTRESYKDKHKQKAFDAMKDCGLSLSLHPRVVDRATWLFTDFRDDRDKVQKDRLVWAACLVGALRETEMEDVYVKEEDPSAVDERALAFKRKREDLDAVKLAAKEER